MIAEFTEKQPTYRYMFLGNGEADVFIYKFIEEKQLEPIGDNQQSQLVYMYDFNTFRTNSVTEEMIKSNPLKYLNYPDSRSFEDKQDEFNLDCDYRLSCLELGITERL